MVMLTCYFIFLQWCLSFDNFPPFLPVSHFLPFTGLSLYTNYLFICLHIRLLLCIGVKSPALSLCLCLSLRLLCPCFLDTLVYTNSCPFLTSSTQDKTQWRRMMAEESIRAPQRTSQPTNKRLTMRPVTKLT